VAEAGPVPALAVLAAYEIQEADIAATKATALTKRYRLAAAGTEFRAVHASAQRDHAEWTIKALELLEASPDSMERERNSQAAAWYAQRWGGAETCRSPLANVPKSLIPTRIP
jgi:hypothetical protein